MLARLISFPSMPECKRPSTNWGLSLTYSAIPTRHFAPISFRTSIHLLMGSSAASTATLFPLLSNDLANVWCVNWVEIEKQEWQWVGFSHSKSAVLVENHPTQSHRIWPLSGILSLMPTIFTRFSPHELGTSLMPVWSQLRMSSRSLP